MPSRTDVHSVMSVTQRSSATKGLAVHPSGRLAAAVAGACILLSVPGAAFAEPDDIGAADLPGMALLARVEARLERERRALLPSLAHYGLVFPVSQPELHRFMAQIRTHGGGADLSLGTLARPESHGGGLLRLLFDHWRPGGRPARLDDAYPFAADQPAVALRRFYDAGRQQLHLPDSRSGSTALPRMTYRFAGPFAQDRVVDRDAYAFLDLLIALESDPSRTWTNRLGQRLSLETLVQSIRAAYMSRPALRSEPADHSLLHLAELLVAYEEATGSGGLPAVRRRFVDSELGADDPDPGFATELLGHRAETLGRLLAADELVWRGRDRRSVRDWLAVLETSGFGDVEEVPLQHLAHLAAGLRSVRRHADRLTAGTFPPATATLTPP